MTPQCTSPHSPLRSPPKALSTSGIMPLPQEPKPASPQQQVSVEDIEGTSENEDSAKRRKLDSNSKQ